MSILSSLPALSTAAVIGAFGGIGNAFVELLGQEPRIKKIYPFSRAPAVTGSAKVRNHFIDITREDAARDAASQTAAHLRHRVRNSCYGGGHMLYTEVSVRRELNHDFARFVRDALKTRAAD
jgi:hypothetical protein